ncbi:hypothetical protein ACFL27_02165 [candidate division CSSED10-310 bacterium]|uniref:Periplasmic heavy metal sensor n=1 Tax=candidate division CSSED10-310 bacterium TaxID=2855610 RepID=A0ABV6YS08_UNCC1
MSGRNVQWCLGRFLIEMVQSTHLHSSLGVRTRARKIESPVIKTALGTILFFIILGQTAPNFADVTDLKSFSKTRQVRHKIQCLNLINGLYLTPAQSQHLLDLNVRVQELLSQCRRQIEPLEEMQLPDLERLHDVLLTGEELEDQVKRKIVRLNERIHGYVADYQSQVKRLAHEAESMLQDYQKEALLEFNPCLFPHSQASSALPIGSAGLNSKTPLLVHLTKIRTMSDYELDLRLDSVLMKHARLLRKRFNDQLNIYQEQKKLVQAIQKIRKMNDVEFELEKENIAQSLIPPERYLKHPPRTPALEQIIIRFFLDPGAAEILRNHLEKE